MMKKKDLEAFLLSLTDKRFEQQGKGCRPETVKVRYRRRPGQLQWRRGFFIYLCRRGAGYPGNPASYKLRACRLVYDR